MANMFMKLGENKIKGGATSLYTGGDKTSKKDGWFTIRSLNWRASRAVSMDIGNGMNRDSGMESMNPITITKEMCGASEVILSRMYVPGPNGDDVHVIITKPAGTGEGSEIYLVIEIFDARVIKADVNIAEGAIPFECWSFSYSKILIKHWNESKGGKLSPGGEVTYDLSAAKAVSHAIKDGNSSPDEL